MKFTKEMLEKAGAAKNGTEILELAKANNIEITEEQANEYYTKLHQSGELADEELDNVAGGGHCSADPNYASGDTPRYQKGQRVKYRKEVMMIGYSQTGEIVNVHLEKSGYENKEFTYDIRQDDDYLDTYIYESQIYQIL